MTGDMRFQANIRRKSNASPTNNGFCKKVYAKRIVYAWTTNGLTNILQRYRQSISFVIINGC